MKQRPDGSFQSSNTPTYDKAGWTQDNSIYRCMVIAVKFSDDVGNVTKNSSNPEVLYDVVILGGFASGNVLTNCRALSSLGGTNNYYERIFQASTKKLAKDRLEDHDGDVVFVAFNQGHSGYPIIISGANALKNKGIFGATKAEGTRSKTQFNGVEETINKSGEYTLKRKGGTYEAKTNVFTSNKDAAKNEAEINLIKNKIEIKDPNSKVTFYKDEEKFEHIVSTKETKYKEVIDGKNESTTKTYKSGLTVLEDGKNDNYKVKTKGTAELNLKAGKVAIGANSIEVLQEISDSLQEVITFANSESQHQHLGNLGYPTDIPITTANWTAMGSALTAIKALIDSIKGTL